MSSPQKFKNSEKKCFQPKIRKKKTLLKQGILTMENPNRSLDNDYSWSQIIYYEWSLLKPVYGFFTLIKRLRRPNFVTCEKFTTSSLSSTALWNWISEILWDSVKIHWIPVNIATLKKISGAILTESQWISTGSQRLSLIQIQSVRFVFVNSIELECSTSKPQDETKKQSSVESFRNPGENPWNGVIAAVWNSKCCLLPKWEFGRPLVAKAAPRSA